MEHQGHEARHVSRGDRLFLHHVGSEFTVEAGGQELPGTSTSTGSWSEYRTDKLGTVNFDKPGNYELSVKPKADPKWRSIGLKSVILAPTAKE